MHSDYASGLNIKLYYILLLVYILLFSSVEQYFFFTARNEARKGTGTISKKEIYWIFK